MPAMIKTHEEKLDALHKHLEWWTGYGEINN